MSAVLAGGVGNKTARALRFGAIWWLWVATSASGQLVSDEVIEEIVVTGYHVKRTGTEGPAPVVVFDQDALETSGFNTLSEFAQFLPYNSQTRSDVARAGLGTTAGTSNFNLRGIGNDSTLTLVNGRRIAPYGNGEFGTELFVDINAIPMAAIERIEILKDGASAIYGADAVAGVVNIILKRNIDGIQAEVGYLATSRGDLDEKTAHLLGGWDWGSGSLVAGLNWFDRSPLFEGDRASLADVDLSASGGPNQRSAFSSPPNAFLLQSGQFDLDPECPETGLIVNQRVEANGGSSCRFNFAQFATHIFESERVGLSLLAGQSIGSGSEIYGELLWTETQTTTVLAPTPIDGFAPSFHPDNPFGEDVIVFHRVLATGDRFAEIDSDTVRAVAGARGEFRGWDWDFGLMWSENELKTAGRNNVLVNEMQNALLGLGGPGGNQFYNPFGLDPANDPAVVESLSIDTFEGARATERSVDFVLTSNVAQLANGPLGIAIGAQLREMELDETLDPLSLAGEVAGGRVGTEIHADRSVWAAFAELNVPLLDSIELQLAVRHEHYDDFGGTTDPKIALEWRPTESLRMHGSFGTSFRAPAFRELFDPLFQRVTFVIDQKRCDVTGDPIDCNVAQIINFETGGNPDLEPEEGQSWFIGVDWEPASVEGLALGAGFWRFEHEKRIVLPQGTSIFDICPDCVLRAPQTPEEEAAGIPGKLLALSSTYINSDELETQGVDLDASYHWSWAGGEWQLGWSHSYLDEYRFPRSLSLDDGAEFTGTVFLEPLPEHRGNGTISWARGIHHLRAIAHYVGEYESNLNLHVDGLQTNSAFTVSSWASLDVQYEITLERLRDALIRLGCQNCLDREPSTFNSFETRNTKMHDKRGLIYYIRWTQPF